MLSGSVGNAKKRDTRIYHQPNPPFRGSSRRHTRRLSESKGQGSPFREGSATARPHRPPGSYRNKRELASRHRAAHRDRTTAHRGWGAERILDFKLARTKGSRGPANRAPGLFRKRFPPPSSSRDDSS